MLSTLALAAATFFYWSPVATSYSPDTNTVVVGGRVLDGNGRVVPHAFVMISSNGDIQRTQTNAEGRYIFFHLKPAHYRIEAWQGPCRRTGGNETHDADLPAGNRFEWDLHLACEPLKPH